MAGLALGLARMGLELAYPTPRCGVPDPRPWLLADLHYLHFAVLLCAATGAVVVGGSLLTPPPPPNRVSSARGHPGPLHPKPPLAGDTSGTWGCALSSAGGVLGVFLTEFHPVPAAGSHLVEPAVEAPPALCGWHTPGTPGW